MSLNGTRRPSKLGAALRRVSWWPWSAGLGLVLHGCVPGAGAQNATPHPPSVHPAQEPPPRVSEHALDPIAIGPPPQAALVSGQTDTWQTASNGARLCFQHRSDLAGTFIGLSLAASWPPEDLLTLRSWLWTTFERHHKTGRLQVFQSPGPLGDCGPHFFCGWVASSEAKQAAQLLGEFIRRPETATFPIARERAIESAEELFLRSATFRLGSLVESLRDGRKANFKPPFTPLLLDAELGEQRASQLSAMGLGLNLQRHVKSLKITLLSPTRPQALADEFGPLLSGPGAGPLSAGARSQLDNPLVLLDDRFVQSALYFTWPAVPPAHNALLHARLEQLALSYAHQDPSVLATVHPGNGLVQRPALLMNGPHEVLMQVASVLLDLAQRSPPTSWSSPIPKRRSETQLAPCSAVQPSAQSPALTDWGSPQVVIWGAPAPKESQEVL